MAIVVRDQDGFGLVGENGPEQQLQFFRAIANQPATGFLLRGCGVHRVSFAPSIQETVWSKRQATSA